MTFASMAMFRADGLQGFTRFALHLVPGFVLIGLVSLAGLCIAHKVVAQEVDAPAAPGPESVSGSIVAPSGWLVLIAPVHDRIDLKLYGFYIGDLEVPVVQFDVHVRTTKSLTVTPSYMYYSVPASGLNEMIGQPNAFTDSYEEHQFRIDGTFTFSIRNFEISARNMYVRRFRPTPADDINRYRGRIMIAHPLAVKGHIWKPFTSYETYYDGGGGGWNRDRVWVGVTLPLMKQVSFQPSFLWEKSDGLKDVNYLMFGLIVNTK
jgi:hypothetical protein